MYETPEEIETRIGMLNTLGTDEDGKTGVKRRAITLRHAVGMTDGWIKSPSKDTLAHILAALDDGENDETAGKTVGELKTAYTPDYLKELVADALGEYYEGSIGGSVGPILAPTIALLEKKEGKDIATLAREAHSDDDYSPRIPDYSPESSDDENDDDE